MGKKTSYDHKEVLQLCEGEIFGDDAPKFPRSKMLMIDRIDRVSENEGKYNKGVVIATFDIRPDLWFFECHFKNDPVMPGCLGLDGMWQLIGFYLAWMGYKGKGRALGVKEVKFTGEVIPKNKVVKYIVDIKRVINLKLVMAIADGRLEVDSQEIYRATDMRVGLFSNNGMH